MKLAVAVTTLALLASTAGFAQQPSPNSTQAPAPAASPNAMQSPPSEAAPTGAADSRLAAVFDKLNTSHTGKLTREEAQAHPTVAANFDAADANKDGVVTKDEFLAAFKSQ